MKKLIGLLSVVLFCMLAAAGCSNKSGGRDIPEVNADGENNGTEEAAAESREKEKTQAQKDLEYLTSEECEGRKAGTLGNEKAAEYIIKRYEEIGLAPFGRDYRSGYSGRVETIDAGKIKLEILDKDGAAEELVFGEDFIEGLLSDASLTLPLLEEPGNEDCAVLAGDLKSVEKLKKNPRVKLVLRLEESCRRTGNFYEESGVPELRVFPGAYERLKERVGKTVSFSVEADITEDAMLDNIVGMLKGEDSTHALIISAHFDHAGSAGKTIWRGAYDNASGVCALLETAEAVRDYYKEAVPPCDILFCAFNSEEVMGHEGSTGFNEQIGDEYKTVFDINLDCVGAADAASLNIIANENEASEQIKEEMTESLAGAGIGEVAGVLEGGSSDHQSFTNAVCLSTISDMASSRIHTLEDVPERIDTEYLERLGGAIASFVIDDLDVAKLFAAPESEYAEGGHEPPWLLTAEFEELYQCRLDFADDCLLGIKVDAGYWETAGEDYPALEDIRLISIYVDKDRNSDRGDGSIDYTVDDKDDSWEMGVMEKELKVMGYGEDYASSPVMIGGLKYYLSDELENHFKWMSTFYENEARIVRVTVGVPGSEDYDEEDYIARFNEIVPEGYIGGMAELLLSAAE